MTRISSAQSLYAAQVLQTEKAAPAPRAGASTKGELAIRRTDKLELSVDAANRYMQEALLTETGQKIQSLFEHYGVELPAANGTDWSADATAQRIFDFASPFLELYRLQNPELAEAEAIDSFETIIRGAVDKGVGEALDMLETGGLREQSQDLAHETQRLIHQKFDVFFAEARSILSSAGGEQGD